MHTRYGLATPYRLLLAQSLRILLINTLSSSSPFSIFEDVPVSGKLPAEHRSICAKEHPSADIQYHRKSHPSDALRIYLHQFKHMSELIVYVESPKLKQHKGVSVP